MKAAIHRFDPAAGYATPELCAINQPCNRADDPDRSIARARVAPGATTRGHRLRDTTERHVITGGRGRVEVGGLSAAEIGVGDVVLIPPGCPQRITNTGATDLVFLVLCTPRFRPQAYQDIEGAPGSVR